MRNAVRCYRTRRSSRVKLSEALSWKSLDNNRTSLGNAMNRLGDNLYRRDITFVRRETVPPFREGSRQTRRHGASNRKSTKARISLGVSFKTFYRQQTWYAEKLSSRLEGFLQWRDSKLLNLTFRGASQLRMDLFTNHKDRLWAKNPGFTKKCSRCLTLRVANDQRISVLLNLRTCIMKCAIFAMHCWNHFEMRFLNVHKVLRRSRSTQVVK